MSWNQNQQNIGPPGQSNPPNFAPPPNSQYGYPGQYPPPPYGMYQGGYQGYAPNPYQQYQQPGPYGYPPQQGYPPPQGPPSSSSQQQQGPSGPPPQGPPSQDGSQPPQQGPPPQGPPPQGPPPQGPPPQGPPPMPPPTTIVKPLIEVFGPQYVLPYETTLIMQEGWRWARDDMDVMDVMGIPHFRLRCQILSARHKRALYDLQGQAICSTMQKMFSIHQVTLVCPGSNPKEREALCQVRKVLLSFIPEAQVFMKGNKSNNPDLRIQGTFSERRFQITNAGGRALADIGRDLSVRMAMTGQDTFYVKIYPGVDIAFITALVTIIEEVFIEEGQRGDTGWVQ